MAGFFLMIAGAVAFVLRIPTGAQARGGVGETIAVSVSWVAIGLFALIIGGTAMMCVGHDFCLRGVDADAWMLPFILLPIAVPAVLVIVLSAMSRRLG